MLTPSKPYNNKEFGDRDNFFLDSPFSSPCEPMIVDSGDGHRISAPSTPARLANKRKSTSSRTPLRQHSLTPLKITSALNPRSPFAFDRLAPPNLAASPTPSQAADLPKQTASLTRLRLSDMMQTDVPSLLLTSDVHDDPHQQIEVAEAVSPGGHITKRRAKSRVVSSQLLESTQRLANRGRPSVAFPSTRHSHRRNLSSHSSSSSETGSPRPRRRVAGAQKPSHSSQLRTTRGPMTRVDSATLFFGPAVPSTGPSARLRATSGATSTTAARPKMPNRHSYACGESPSWGVMRSKLTPQSSPLSAPQGDADVMTTDDEDMLFDPIQPDSSFTFSMSDGPPFLRPKTCDTMVIPKKYNPRDSGVVVSDDDYSCVSGDSTDNMHHIPRASTSVSSICSDGDGLITPGIGPTSSASWPNPAVADEYTQEGADVDAFIMRTLAAATRGPQDVKKVPGTPVKKVKTMAGERPWQSAAATHKVGIEWKTRKAPRKSLPAALVSSSTGNKGKSPPDPSTDSEDEGDESPSARRDRYPGLGLGRPPFSAMHRVSWLSRRSSSGALSNGSDSTMSINGTPSKKGKEWPLQIPRLTVQFSPSKNSLRLSPGRSASGSSTSSAITLNSPIMSRYHQNSGEQPHKPSFPRQASQPGRFERDFVQIDEVGSGEFGQVIKVRIKGGDEHRVFAIKKSQRFEGVKHRLRLKEEVDILEHLTRANNGLRHPNVLGFVDSWEEGDMLFIQTELCELGNFARFLWEYGRAFPRLDEARVWKIIVDLSNGLRFIHDTGVIHLDLKPGNIFMTAEGRFKIGDFGMASLWPRSPSNSGGFEREGDKLYLAPEVLQGKYGKAADVFSFGMTILETAANIVVPDQGDAWHRLREEDFSQIELADSPVLLKLIQQMMRTEPSLRLSVHAIWHHPVVCRARAHMQRAYATAKREGTSTFAASPLAHVNGGFLEEILGRTGGVEQDICYELDDR